MKADAVFEGGGVKCIGLAGAVKAAEEQGYAWEHVAGTSAGALIAALLAAGYTAEELYQLLLEVDYSRFRDKGLLNQVPVVGTLLSFLLELGLYEGRQLYLWTNELLEAKGVTTFADLIHPKHTDNPRFRYRLRVIASDITNGRMLVLPQDIASYGREPDELSVAAAVRMSMSLPFFYEPVLLKDMSSTGGGPALVVDGGLLSNFPVWLFDTSGIPEWPTFGFGLTKGEGAKPHTVRGPLSMLWALFATMLEAHDERAMEDQDYVRTIQVPTLGVDTVDFNISAEQAQALFDAGYRTAQAFFDGWDFDTYVRLYRKDTSLHGRQLSL